MASRCLRCTAGIDYRGGRLRFVIDPSSRTKWVLKTDTMGIVLVTPLIENQNDVVAAEEGRIPDLKVRRIEIHDARVDTGATFVSMPLRLIN